MRLLHTAIALVIVINSTSARCRRPRINPVMGALQNIFSPANADRTMQMLQSAAQRSIGNNYNPFPQIQYSPPTILQQPSPYSPIQTPSVPVQPIQTPIEVQVQSPVYQMPVQLPVQPAQLPIQPVQLPVQPVQLPVQPVQLPVQPAQLPVQPVQLPVQPVELPVQPVQLPVQPAQMPVQPAQLPAQPVQLPLSPPVSVSVAPIPMPEIILEPPCPRQREIAFLSSDLPNYFFENNQPSTSVIAPVALTPEQDVYTCPLPSPASLFTFPAASPCSCFVKETSAPRSQYLRKITIPPPTM